ncbi:unnamed protein product, partial [Brassica oleracea]
MKSERLYFCILLTLLIFNGPSLLTTAQDPTSSSCKRTCGGISIPFPFGIGPKHCYLNDWYEVVSNTTTTSLSTPFLSKINRELVSIVCTGFENFHGIVHIKFPVISSGCSTGDEKPLPLNLTGEGNPFF